MIDNCHIYFGVDATSFDLYHNVIPQLHKYFESKSHSKLILDFSHVDFVSPLVIPNILTVGYILKNHFKEPVELLVPWKPKLLSYLYDVGFLRIAKEYAIFAMDENYIGGLNVGNLYPGCFTYIFGPELDYEDIRYQLMESINIITELAEITLVKLDDKGERLLNLLTEVCYNACIHSNNLCFATIQTNLIDTSRHKKAYLSISDCGQGFYKTLTAKYANNEEIPILLEKDEFISLDPVYQNTYSILEAVLYRQKYKIFGLYQVIDNVITIGGVVRVHCDDTQIVFTRDSFKKYIDNPKMLLDNLKTKFEKVILKELDIKYSPIRKTSTKLKGVHIEIEVPIN